MSDLRRTMMHELPVILSSKLGLFRFVFERGNGALRRGSRLKRGGWHCTRWAKLPDL